MDSNKAIPKPNDGEPKASSSSQGLEDELHSFREKWQKELLISPESETTEEPSKFDENEAKTLFLKGVDLEKNGNHYEAIKFYKKAMQIIPDIEFKLNNSVLKVEKSQKVHVEPKDKINYKEGELLKRISKKVSKDSRICSPKFEQKSTHISVLPPELILYILRWVVTCELDLRSLEMFGKVCRGFYVCSRDQEIWRLACMKVWGLNTGKTLGVYRNWREMFLERPRLRFNGCYISKTTYIRHGENSFQDEFYRAWHLVAYYRYFRFFPEGIVLMLTSPDEPTSCVSLLKQRTTRLPVLSGFYRLKNDLVTIIINRQEFKKNNVNNDHTYHIEFQIADFKKKKNVQLQWTHYSVRTKSKKGEENVCIFDLVNNKFPVLWFSRVKSYTTEAEMPL